MTVSTTTQKARPARKPRKLSPKQLRDKRLRDGARYLSHLSAILVGLFLLYRWWTYYYDPNEIEGFTRVTGTIGLIYLIVSLVVTPLTWLGLKWLAPSRRPLGLYAFAAIAVHLIIFVGFDYGWDPGFVVEGILQKRYALAGLGSFGIMTALAVTSNTYSIKRLKKNWKKLHKWVYLSAILAIVHYLWLVKPGDYLEPIIYGSITAALLMIRVKPIRQRIIQAKKDYDRSKRAAAKKA